MARYLHKSNLLNHKVDQLVSNHRENLDQITILNLAVKSFDSLLAKSN